MRVAPRLPSHTRITHLQQGALDLTPICGSSAAGDAPPSGSGPPTLDIWHLQQESSPGIIRDHSRHPARVARGHRLTATRPDARGLSALTLICIYIYIYIYIDRYRYHVHNMDQATLFNKHSEHPHALPPSGFFVLGSISNG